MFSLKQQQQQLKLSIQRFLLTYLEMLLKWPSNKFYFSSHFSLHFNFDIKIFSFLQRIHEDIKKKGNTMTFLQSLCCEFLPHPLEEYFLYWNWTGFLFLLVLMPGFYFCVPSIFIKFNFLFIVSMDKDIKMLGVFFCFFYLFVVWHFFPRFYLCNVFIPEFFILCCFCWCWFFLAHSILAGWFFSIL